MLNGRPYFARRILLYAALFSRLGHASEYTTLDCPGAQETPQVLSDGSLNGLDVLRYSADLATVLSDTPLSIPTGFPGLAMSIDPQGVTTLLGGTSNVNLALVHPTQVCYPGSGAFLVRLDSNGDVLQSTFLNIPPRFITGTSLSFNSGGASYENSATGRPCALFKLGS